MLYYITLPWRRQCHGGHFLRFSKGFPGSEWNEYLMEISLPLVLCTMSTLITAGNEVKRGWIRMWNMLC